MPPKTLADLAEDAREHIRAGDSHAANHPTPGEYLDEVEQERMEEELILLAGPAEESDLASIREMPEPEEVPDSSSSSEASLPPSGTSSTTRQVRFQARPVVGPTPSYVEDDEALQAERQKAVAKRTKKANAKAKQPPRDAVLTSGPNPFTKKPDLSKLPPANTPITTQKEQEKYIAETLSLSAPMIGVQGMTHHELAEDAAFVERQNTNQPQLTPAEMQSDFERMDVPSVGRQTRAPRGSGRDDASHASSSRAKPTSSKWTSHTYVLTPDVFPVSATRSTLQAVIQQDLPDIIAFGLNNPFRLVRKKAPETAPAPLTLPPLVEEADDVENDADEDEDVEMADAEDEDEDNEDSDE
jgi:hypothetical protein